MYQIFNRLFGRKNEGGKGRNNKKMLKNPTATAGYLNNMPENVLYGEDSGAIPSEDFDNQLED